MVTLQGGDDDCDYVYIYRCYFIICYSIFFMFVIMNMGVFFYLFFFGDGDDDDDEDDDEDDDDDDDGFKQEPWESIVIQWDRIYDCYILRTGRHSHVQDVQ